MSSLPFYSDRGLGEQNQKQTQASEERGKITEGGLGCAEQAPKNKIDDVFLKKN